ncbi:MAG TPA: hypothetical protein VFQ70_03035 [Candidatus Saccharimonadaceae bacterium]|nr:hypothetical protein [Candidatus Saccharimonadaceae bacterium]
MKVYFACSIRGGGDTSQYLAILEAIKAAGGEVISEVFVHDALNLGGGAHCPMNKSIREIPI